MWRSHQKLEEEEEKNKQRAQTHFLTDGKAKNDEKRKAQKGKCSMLNAAEEKKKERKNEREKTFSSLIHGIEWSAHRGNRINQIKLLFADENYRGQFVKLNNNKYEWILRILGGYVEISR